MKHMTKRFRKTASKSKKFRKTASKSKKFRKTASKRSTKRNRFTKRKIMRRGGNHNLCMNVQNYINNIASSNDGGRISWATIRDEYRNQGYLIQDILPCIQTLKNNGLLKEDPNDNRIFIYNQ